MSLNLPPTVSSLLDTLQYTKIYLEKFQTVVPQKGSEKRVVISVLLKLSVSPSDTPSLINFLDLSITLINVTGCSI